MTYIYTGLIANETFLFDDSMFVLDFDRDDFKTIEI